MQNINFKNLYIKNFLSVGEIPVRLEFEKGLCLITGENLDKPERSNGVGKSTLADAIHFGLFGETIREIKKDLIPNYYTNGKTVIQIAFDQGNDCYELTRTINPTTARLVKNGVDETKDTIANTNEQIEKIIRCNSKIFNNCISLGINSSNCFMNMKKSEKREYIESILDLDIFSKMTEICKSELSEERKMREGLTAKKETYDSILEDYVKQKKEFEQKRKQNISDLQEKIKFSEHKIKILKDELENVQQNDDKNYQEKIDQTKNAQKIIDEKLSCTEKSVATLQSESKNIKKMIDEIKDHSGICPSCLREIDDSCKDHIENKKTQMQVQIEEIACKIKQETEKKIKLLSKKSEAESILESFRIKEKDHERQKFKKDQNKKLIEQIESSINEFYLQIEKEKSRNENFDKNIQENEKKKNDLTEKITESDKR